MRVAHVARDAAQVRVALHERLEDLVLLLIARLQRYAVLEVALAVVVLVLPQMIRLDAQQDIDIRQAPGAEVARLLPRPQLAAEVAVEADRQPLFLRHAQHVHDELAAIRPQRRGDAAQVQPVKALQQRAKVVVREVILRQGAVLAVIDDLARADAVARLQIVRAQPVGGRLLRGGEDHRRAVDVVGAQHTHRALAEAVVGHDRKERAVHAEIGQRQRDVGLAAAIAGFKARSHADLLVVGRRQTEHDLAHRDELLSLGFPHEQRI